MVAKYFWFLEKIDEGLAEVAKIESEKNWADIFTKNCGTIVGLGIGTLRGAAGALAIGCVG